MRLLVSFRKSVIPVIDNQNLKSISIVVSLKNESGNIENLINSLANLDYPADKFEAIFVDDNSSDNTFELLRNYTSRINHFRVLKSNYIGNFGKKYALDYGISESRFDLIVFTDADCTYGSNWLNTFSQMFEANDVVIGCAPYWCNPESTFMQLYFCFENMRNHIITFAAANLGIPYSAASRSFGFRKSAFLAVNGYQDLYKYKSGDDDLLLQKFIQAKYNINAFTNTSAFAVSEPPKRLNSYLKQRSRHVSTSARYSTKVKLFLAIWHILNIVFACSFLFSFFHPFFVIPTLLKILIDIQSGKRFEKEFNLRFSFTQIFTFSFLYEILLVVNYWNSRTKSIVWK
ncbi:MAG: glycosyltransferase [Melioribacteraceae bacterium]|nr:glycosyltransferase [Melioribacteraceae bacterium]MCF8432522.1 glycosyltransferase [Melioribacteraceae bacterium]